jgi:hypothetical protein
VGALLIALVLMGAAILLARMALRELGATRSSQPMSTPETTSALPAPMPELPPRAYLAQSTSVGIRTAFAPTVHAHHPLPADTPAPRQRAKRASRRRPDKSDTDRRLVAVPNSVAADPMPAPQKTWRPESQWRLPDPRLMLFDYTDAAGETSNRAVEVKSLAADNGNLYLQGYCRLRHAHRTFRVDRIATLVDSETGEVATTPLEVVRLMQTVAEDEMKHHEHAAYVHE